MKKGKIVPSNEIKGSVIEKYPPSQINRNKSKQKIKVQNVPSVPVMNKKDVPKVVKVTPPQINQVKSVQIKKQPEIKK